MSFAATGYGGSSARGGGGGGGGFGGRGYGDRGGGGGGGGGGAVGGTYQKPNGDADVVESQIASNIKQIQANVTQLRRMTEQLGTPRDSLALRKKLRATVDDTRPLAKDTAAALKRYAGMPAADRKKKKIAQDKLSTDLQRWLHEFAEVSKLSAQRERETTPRAPATAAKESGGRGEFEGIGIGGGGATPYGGGGGGGGYYDDNDDENAGLLAAERQRQEFAQLEADREFQSAVIEEREAAIEDIAKAVTEVNEIFQEVAGLVQEQGVLVDHIESNIDKTDTNVEKGVSELVKASEHQKSYRSKLCCILLTLVILAGVTAIVLFFMLK